MMGTITKSRWVSVVGKAGWQDPFFAHIYFTIYPYFVVEAVGWLVGTNGWVGGLVVIYLDAELVFISAPGYEGYFI